MCTEITEKIVFIDVENIDEVNKDFQCDPV